MLRCASVGPMRVAVIHIGVENSFPNSSFFLGKSNYFNSWQTEVDDGMVIAKNSGSLRADVCFPSIRKQAILIKLIESSEEKRCD